jgi:membrane dipeptidase
MAMSRRRSYPDRLPEQYPITHRRTDCAAWALLVASVTALSPLPIAGAAVIATSPAVVDLHVDLSYRVRYAHGTFARGSGQYVASRLLAAGVAGAVLPLFVPSRVSPTGPRTEDLEGSYADVVSLIPKTPPYALPGCRAKAGSVRTWLSFEGSAPLAGDPEAIARWVSRGVRLFGLVHTSDNVLATSSSSTSPSSTGLTEAGREFAHRVQRAGGIIDVSHASDRATDDMIRLALEDGVPAVATHSNARALTAHPRNLTDDQIRGIAQTGGVVGVNLYSRFVKIDGEGKAPARIEDVVRHVRHLVAIGGVDHVAIGSDFEGDIRPPVGMDDVRGFPRLAAALETSGVSRSDVAKIFGQNALRVLCPR